MNCLGLIKTLYKPIRQSQKTKHEITVTGAGPSLLSKKTFANGCVIGCLKLWTANPGQCPTASGHACSRFANIHLIGTLDERFRRAAICGIQPVRVKECLRILEPSCETPASCPCKNISHLSAKFDISILQSGPADTFPLSRSARKKEGGEETCRPTTPGFTCPAAGKCSVRVPTTCKLKLVTSLAASRGATLDVGGATQSLGSSAGCEFSDHVSLLSVHASVLATSTGRRLTRRTGLAVRDFGRLKTGIASSRHGIPRLIALSLG